MNEELKSQISAFVDGELPESEADLLSRRLSQDAGLRQQAAAYFQIGRLMRGEPSVSGANDVHKRVSSELVNDEIPAAPLPSVPSARWLKPLGGVAIAASVAMLALFGLRQLDVPGPETTAIVANDAAPYTEPLAIDVLADRPSDMLMQYYLSHGETSGELGANGILSRLVTLELRGGELVEIQPVSSDTLETAPPQENTNSTDDAQEQ